MEKRFELADKQFWKRPNKNKHFLNIVRDERAHRQWKQQPTASVVSFWESVVVCVTLHCAQLHFFIFSRCFKGKQFSREQNNKFNMKIKQVMDLLFFSH